MTGAALILAAAIGSTWANAESAGTHETAADENPLGKILARFDFGDAELPKAISTRQGQWSVGNGVLTQSAELANASFAQVDVGDITDYRLHARMKMLESRPGALAGIVARLQPDGFCYMLCLHVRDDGRKNIQLWRGQPDAANPCITIGAHHPNVLVADSDFVDEIQLADWHELALDCLGQNVLGYLDGVPRLSYTFGVGPVGIGESKTPPPLDGGSPGLCAVKTRAEFDDVAVWELATDSHIPTSAHGLFDAEGRLLPCKPYTEFLDRLMDWNINVKRNVLLIPSEGTFQMLGESYKVTPNGFQDAEGHLWPSYCVGSYLHGNNALYWKAGSEMYSIWCVTGFPLFEGLLSYYAYSGRPECLELAREGGDWLIETRRSADSPLAMLPRTFLHKDYQEREEELREDVGYGVPMCMRGWLQLYAVTEDRRYLDAAVAAGEQLLRMQQPDGSWRSLYNAATGEAQDKYPNDWIFPAIILMEELARHTGDTKWRESRDRAMDFALQGCLKTMRFRGAGHCADLGPYANPLSCMAFFETFAYFVRRLPEHPEYAEIVKRLYDHAINSQLIARDGYFPGGCGVQETGGGPWGFGGLFTMPYVGLFARLYETTQDEQYRTLAFDMFNTSTYFQFGDGKVRQAMWMFLGEYPLVGAPTGAAPAIDFMSVFPRTAPDDENHMLRWSGDIQSIDYRPNQIAYRTLSGGTEMFKLGAGEPTDVFVEGKKLPKVEELAQTDDAWSHDTRSKVLRVRHSGRKMVVQLEPTNQ